MRNSRKVELENKTDDKQPKIAGSSKEKVKEKEKLLGGGNVEKFHEVEIHKIGTLIPDPNNANAHTERQILALMEALTRFGQRRPVVANFTTNVVIAGNGVLEAAKRLGWQTIQVMFVDDDVVTAAAYGVADNKLGRMSHWDETILRETMEALDKAGDPSLLIGWSTEEVDELLGRMVEDEPPPPKTKPEPLEVEVDEGEGATVKPVTIFVPVERYEEFHQAVGEIMLRLETDDFAEAVIHAVCGEGPVA